MTKKVIDSITDCIATCMSPSFSIGCIEVNVRTRTAAIAAGKPAQSRIRVYLRMRGYTLRIFEISR